MDGVISWIVGLMYRIGAPGVGIAIAIETVFPPIPSELILPLAGFTASRGYYSLVAAILWATLGSLVGGWILYCLGRAWGAERLGDLAERTPLLERRDIERAGGWFDRHGPSSVLVGRFVPGVRSFVSIPAGIARMNIFAFTFYTAVGSAIFNTALIVVGHELGARYHLVKPYIDTIGLVVGVFLAVVVVIAVTRRVLHRRARGG